MPSCPDLETPRLRLRPHRTGDLEACLALWTDPVVTRFTIGRPSTRAETWTRILRYAGFWSLLGYGYWAVEEKATGSFIGELGFADFLRDYEPSIEGLPELGWALAWPARGKGYATEALRAVLEWADTDAVLRAGPTVCIIDPANTASTRVAGKIGYRELARGTKDGAESLLFERHPMGASA